MTLSAAECAELEPLAAEWLARVATPAQLVQALTAGLPAEVHCPGALARSRLTAKLPPEPLAVPATPESAATAPQRIMECTACARPGRPEALPGGLCRDCRGDVAPDHETADGLTAARIRDRVARLRIAARTPAQLTS